MIQKEVFISADTKAMETALLAQAFLQEMGVDCSVIPSNDLNNSLGCLHLSIDITITSDFIIDEQNIIGKDSQQLFYGVLKYWGNQLSGGTSDKYYTAAIAERCLMIDIGRKFYSLAELKAVVRSMACFQLTHLQLHFSENEGFRIECETHPEIVSQHYLTKDEIRELITYAQKYYIELIPDLDSPGHLQKILEKYPEWQLPNRTGNTDKKALNILDPEAVEFIKSLYFEYAALFSESQYFHIGADEFIDFDHLEKYPVLASAAKERHGSQASGIEIFVSYVNDIITYVKQLGFTVRVWNDGFYRLNRNEHLTLSKECEISYWTRWNLNMAPVTLFLEKGYKVINHNDNYFYYVLGEAAGYTYPTYEKICHGFELTTFARGQKITETDLTQVPALALAVWADIPDAKSGKKVVCDIFWLQAALSQKVYNSKPIEKNVWNPLFSLWKKTIKE